jgi:hypothetical protein
MVHSRLLAGVKLAFATSTIAKEGLPMQASEIHDYASRLRKDHGDKAQLIAAQRAVECEKRGDQGEAQDWRRICDALKEMQGPHVS